MKNFLLMLFLLGTLTNIYAQTKFIKIGTTTDALRLAMLNGNRQALDDLTDGSLSYGHSSGKIEGKASFLQSLSSGTSDFLTLDITNQTITEYKNSAVVRHNLQGDTNDNGVAGKVKLHVMQVWIKKNKEWKLVARQAVKM